eukprot:2485581-Pyramimonas_sp.AAC.3
MNVGHVDLHGDAVLVVVVVEAVGADVQVRVLLLVVDLELVYLGCRLDRHVQVILVDAVTATVTIAPW